MARKEENLVRGVQHSGASTWFDGTVLEGEAGKEEAVGAMEEEW